MNLKLMYEQDFQQWLEYQIALLRNSRFNEIDIEHLIEELAGMGNSDKRELVSHFRILLTHLLKWQFQYRELTDKWEKFTGGSWRGSISEHRTGIIKQLKMSPSLRRYLSEAVNEAYPDALKIANKETGLPSSVFPDRCPYTL
ncbi:MAG: hypothetical protein BWK79_06870, partial [Beggiatoa sp. IS2]